MSDEMGVRGIRCWDCWQDWTNFPCFVYTPKSRKRNSQLTDCDWQTWAPRPKLGVSVRCKLRRCGMETLFYWDRQIYFPWDLKRPHQSWRHNSSLSHQRHPELGIAAWELVFFSFKSCVSQLSVDQISRNLVYFKLDQGHKSPKNYAKSVHRRPRKRNFFTKSH